MARRRSNTGIPGLSFSAKRATGVSRTKRKIARSTGIPMTKQGRRAKVGRAMGCSLYLLAIVVIALVVILIFI